MKLGFIYTVTSGGYDDQKVRINPEGWSHVVEDERQLWLKYNSNNECIAMTIVKDGVVFAITRIIGGDRADNNVSTWVYIPAKIKISGTQIINIIEAIKEINKSGTKRITENSFLENSILNENYPEKDYGITLIASNGNECAFRYPTGDYTLAEILDFPFQNYYHNYKYIFIYNYVPSPKPAIKDLSNMEIAEQICVLPPSQNTINEMFGYGAILKYSDGQLANKPYYGKKGEIISFIVEKDGCIPMPIKGQATEDEKDIEITAYGNSWKRIINDSYFKIIDSKTGEIIRGARVQIDDSTWDRSTQSISEDRLRSVKVIVSTNGYETFNDTLNISNPPALIKLEKIIEKATYYYTSKNNQELKITVSGTGARSFSPLEGYVAYGNRLKFKGTNSDSNHNHKHKKFSWTAFCYGFLCCIVLVLLSWGGYELYNWLFPSKNLQPPVIEIVNDSGEVGYDAMVDTHSLDYAINYLESTDVWNRDSLIQYSDLEGLYEELNTYNFTQIKNRQSKLNRSQRFNNLLKAINDYKSEPPTGTYTVENDLNITVSTYIDRLNSKNNPEKESQSSGVASDAAKKAGSKKNNSDGKATKNPSSQSNNNQNKRGGV